MEAGKKSFACPLHLLRYAKYSPDAATAKYIVGSKKRNSLVQQISISIISFHFLTLVQISSIFEVIGFWDTKISSFFVTFHSVAPPDLLELVSISLFIIKSSSEPGKVALMDHYRLLVFGIWYKEHSAA